MYLPCLSVASHTRMIKYFRREWRNRISFFIPTMYCNAIIFDMAGHGNIYRTCRNLTAKCASIFTRLESQTLTGNKLQLNIHQYLGYNVLVTWMISTTKHFSSADRCFERWFDNYEECDSFCQWLRQKVLYIRNLMMLTGIFPMINRLNL